MLPASAMLGLHAPDETITIEDKTTIDLDSVAHDIRKFATDDEPQWLRSRATLLATRGGHHSGP